MLPDEDENDFSVEKGGKRRRKTSKTDLSSTAQALAAKLGYSDEEDEIDAGIVEGEFVDYDPAVSASFSPEEKPLVSLPEGKAQAIATGCIPCAIGHIGTCSGVINEAVRFARSDGMVSDEVINRVGMCLDELNSMERVDLRPEMLVQLPPWEKALAQKVLEASRKMRHSLEAMDDVDSLEEVAAETQSARQEVWRDWVKKKMTDTDGSLSIQKLMDSLSPEEKERVQERLRAKIAELAAQAED